MNETLQELEKASIPILKRLEAKEYALKEARARELVAAIARMEGVPFEELWSGFHMAEQRFEYTFSGVGLGRVRFGFPEHCPIEFWPATKEQRHREECKIKKGKLTGDYSWYVWGWPKSYHTKCDTFGIALVVARREYEANKAMGEYDA